MKTALRTMLIGLLVAGTAVAGQGDFQGDLDEALKRIYAGEGGRDGIGLTKLWPRISAPALAGEQLRKVLIGNTLHEPDTLAIYFNANGTLESWFDEWTDASASVCPTGRKRVPGDEWRVVEGHCQHRTLVPVTGTWKIKDHQICPDLRWDGAKTQHFRSGRNDTCWYAALVLDQVVLFDTDGEIQGKGKHLQRGRQLDQVVE